MPVLMQRLRYLIFLLLCFGANAGAQTSLSNAAIASAHPLATAAGKTILDQGGNAFDAAVAVAATLAVVEPYSSGLGGGGFFLLHRARDGKQVMLDARERAPLRATTDMYSEAPQASLTGARAAAIPGLPAGLAHLAKRYGRLPLKQSLAPAIGLAQHGFAADARYRAVAQTRLALLQTQPDAAMQFLHHQAVPELDTLVVQANLANTLRALAQQGAPGFYSGAVAREMVTAVKAAKGIWQRADLARYRVVERAPIIFDYRGLHIVSAAPPSAGGLSLAQALHILEAYDFRTLSEVQRMHLVAEALRRAYHDRARYLGDPDFVRMPIRHLTSPGYAAFRAANIDLANATPSVNLDPEIGRAHV